MAHEDGSQPEFVNDDIRKQQLTDLNDVREQLSSIMAEDFKDFKGPRMVGQTLRQTPERIDRSSQRTDLQNREDRLMREIREQTGGPIDRLV